MCWLLRSQQTGARPLPFIQLRGQPWSHSQRRTPDHHLVFNDAVCIMLLSQVATSTFNRTIWNTYFQKLTGWLVTTSHPGLSTTAKLCTGNLKSRMLSYNLEFKVIDFINTGGVAQQLCAKWDRSSPTCLSPQPHSSHCTSSIQPTPSSDSSMEQWHFGRGHQKGHLRRIQRGTLCSNLRGNLPMIFFKPFSLPITPHPVSPQKAWNW